MPRAADGNEGKPDETGDGRRSSRDAWRCLGGLQADQEHAICLRPPTRCMLDCDVVIIIELLEHNVETQVLEQLEQRLLLKPKRIACSTTMPI